REHSGYECRTHPEQQSRPGTVLCEPEPKCEHAHHEAEACSHLRARMACSRDHPFVARQCAEKDEYAQGRAATKQKGRSNRRQQCKVKGIGERDRLWAVSENPNQSRMDRSVVVDR